MLFPMPSRTPWSSSEGRRSSSQNILPVVGFISGKYDVNAMKVDFFFCRIGEEPEDQVYREKKQQLHVR